MSNRIACFLIVAAYLAGGSMLAAVFGTCAVAGVQANDVGFFCASTAVGSFMLGLSTLFAVRAVFRLELSERG